MIMKPITNLPQEVWAPACIDSIIIPGYHVSTHGRVKSTLTSTRIGNKFSGTTCNGPEKLMKPVLERHADGSPKSQRVNLSVSSNLFEYSYAYSSNHTNNRERRKVHIHRLVMDTFRPIFNNPPKRLEPFWDELHHDVKVFIYECISIDHIDHDPTNNHIDNLQYVTPRENMRNAIKFYDGDYANKKNIPIKKPEIEVPNILNFL